MNPTISTALPVTVYVPAYNVAEYLPRCLEGLLSQTPPANEILVVDDGSRDMSAEIAAKYPGVTLLRHETNQGLAAARNTGMRAARNELVASVDADCVPAPDWLVQLAGHFEDPSIVGVGGKLSEGVEDGIADRWRAVHMAQHWGDAEIRNPRFLFGCNNVFRKSAVLATGGYDESKRTNGEDVDLCLRLQKKGWNFLYVPTARATHLRHDTPHSILETRWRWWRFGVNAYAGGARLRSVLGHTIQVHFRYNFLEPFLADLRAHRWSLAAFDFLVLAYFPFRDFRLWREQKKRSRQ
jgi:cellulose synthase/poly-beta-1,6-N-acetylglucosamine synthase-like glycosyltransferase